ncbi:TonB-dependent receptor [Chitinophaga sp. 212800010-3]|uniref:TonB-dependent receptor n=1 Tax=unclassified Chitinophaga TaxID=2619133 RepID=UPI002DF06945|nr:TonB-dependent receptor plug [Chitinophaga sp. 212800010-3]
MVLQTNVLCWMILLLMAVRTTAQEKISSGITGVITAGREPLPGVTIRVLETNQAVITGSNGEYTILIKPGEYTVQFQYIGMKKVTRHIILRPRQMERLSVGMTQESRMLGAVSVAGTRRATTEKALLELRRQSANIQDAIGAVQIEKSASITTAQALQRVTGVTVKDGKYITVRGLSDRNVVVQLNGSRLAGADASRSAVAVDLIPAQLLENIVVEKSITPDKPGDANGAVVEIHTRTIPETRFLSVSAQTGFNGNIGLYGYANSFPDAKMGFFGQHVKEQNLTPEYKDLISDYTARGFSTASGTMLSGLTQAIQAGNTNQISYKEAMRINRVMKKGFSPYLATRPEKYGPDQIYSVTYGNRYKLKHQKEIGLVLGINYYNRSQSNPNGENNLYTVKEPVNPGVGAPNINYPNELRLLSLYQLRENTGNRQLNFGGLATISFRFNRFNELSFTYSGNRGTEITATQEDGVINGALKVPDPNVMPFFPDHQHIYNFILRSTYRSLNSFQLRGDHKFRLVKKWRPWQLSYSASRSLANQNDPDYRDSRMRVDSLSRVPNPERGTGRGNQALFIQSEYPYTYYISSDRYYRNMNEQNANYKADLMIPFKIGRDTISFFKAGGYYFGRKRAYTESLFNRADNSATVQNDYGGYSQAPNTLTSLYGDLYAWNGPDAIGVVEYANLKEGGPLTAGYLYVPKAGVTVVPGSTVFINSYKAKQDVTAFYGMFDLHLSPDWRVVGGMRVENTSYLSTPDTTGTNFVQLSGVKTQELFDRAYRTDYLTYNWLPSGSVIYKGLKDLNFRLAYSKTLIRPEMNEIILSAQRDPIQQLTIYGNKHLQNGIFSNYDFRTDWFIGSDELISASAFYKTVDHQIERVYTNGVIDPYGFTNSFVTFRNNPSQGRVYGVELEVRKNLQQLFPIGKYLYIGANLMLAKSETIIDSTEYYILSLLDRNASRIRPLVDQPGIAYNINIDFDYPKWGTQLNLLYNKTGKRLSDINSDGSPNIYEYPAASLDIVWSQRIIKRLEFKAFVKNALNEATRFYYANAGDGHTFGIDNRSYLRRSYNYGQVYTLGLKYTF